MFILQQIAAHSYMAVLARGNSFTFSHCSPLQTTLASQFFPGPIPQKFTLYSTLQPIWTTRFKDSLKFFKSPHISGSSYIAIVAKGGSCSKVFHCSPLQPALISQSWPTGGYLIKSPPIAAYRSPFLHRHFGQGVLPEKFSHPSLFHPTASWHFLSGLGGGVIPQKTSHCSPLLTFIFCRWGIIPQKSSHCSPLQPTLTFQFKPRG